MAELCHTAYNQGDSKYFDLLADRLLLGYEYTAKYNLGYNVTYDPNFYRCGANLVRGKWSEYSNATKQQLGRWAVGDYLECVMGPVLSNLGNCIRPLCPGNGCPLLPPCVC